MRAVVQRVFRAELYADGEYAADISRGMAVFIAFSPGDGADSMEYVIKKIAGLRIFEDGGGKMNLSVADISGEILFIPNFTVYGDARRGTRPSFSASAPYDAAAGMFEDFKGLLPALCPGIKAAFGVFGADMRIIAENDGPVTVLIDSDRVF